MAVTTASAESPMVTDVLVVVLADGRWGFVAPDGWSDQDVAVTLTGEATTVTGSAGTVRSGPAYEQARDRLRAASGRLQRWRLRRDVPVVLVSAD